MNYCKCGNWLLTLLLTGTASLTCTGCFTPINKTETAGLDQALEDDLPKTLAKNKSKNAESLLAKASEAEDGALITSPLQKQLEQLRKEASEQRQALTQSQSQSDELQRRSRELRGSLQTTEAKIAKVEKVIRMINENPAALDNVPLNAGSTLTMAGNAPTAGGFNFDDDEMPALGDAPDRKGASDAWGDTPSKNSLAPALDTFNSFSAPKIAEKAGDVWAVAPEPTVAPAPQPTKIILCDGDSATANFIISRAAGENMEKGMLFKADDKNILVVTDVYATNAKARLHPQYAAGGLKADTVLTKITALP